MTTALLLGMMTATEKRDMATARAYRGWQVRREREQRIVEALPADHVALWRRIAASLPLRITAERTAELVMQYAHDNARDVVESIQDQADADVDAMIAEYQGRAA